MYIKQLRNATILITCKEYKILVDPMFSPKERMFSLKTCRLLRLKKTNPMVDLPENFEESLDGVTHVLLTHNHFDHLDKPAVDYIRSMNLEVYCTSADEEALRKMGLKTIPLKEGLENNFLGGTIEVITGRHGWGWIGETMGPSAGYLIRMPGENTLYVTGDTVLTDNVRRVVTEIKPDWIVLAAGKAKLGVGKPLLMDENEILEVVELSHGKVILNHLDTLDHCLIDRKKIKKLVEDNKLSSKAVIPEDGEEVDCR